MVLFFFNSGETEMDYVSPLWLPKLQEHNSLKVQDYCFENIFFLSSIVLWAVSGNVSLNWACHVLISSA